jgi:hypothetical protein
MADDISTKLAGAKSALQNASNFTKKVEGKTPSMFAPKPPAAAPKVAASQPPANPQGDIGKELAAKAQNVSQYAGMPQMHKGGVVKKDGPVNLKKGETVRTPEQEKQLKDKNKKDQPLTDKAMTKDEPKDSKPAKSEKSDKKESKKAAKVKHKHTHIEHHYDSEGKPTGHTVRHVPMGGGEETSYAAPDLDAVHDGLEEHLGGPAEAPEPPAASSGPPEAV